MQSTPSHPAFRLGMADSWYVVGFSDELESGQIHSVSYFGEKLLLFRDDAGEACLIDSFCSHLGANLSSEAGGRLEKGLLVCPFHSWSWNGKGRCVAIPYADRIPETAQIRSYPVREHGGVIWAWYGAEGGEPAFDLPIRDEMKSDLLHDRWVKHDWTLRTHTQELFENGIDWSHFQFVHGFGPPDEKAVQFDEHTFNWSVTTHVEGERITIHNTVVGLGFAYLRNRDETLMIFGGTPIDCETVHVRMAVAHCGESCSAEESQALELYAKGQAATLSPDFPIWENKLYLERPTLCDADGPLPTYRNWARQFYSKDRKTEGVSG
ncbi:MAG: hypothetical protein CL908_25670 [Deltaproteobacteria bacterium]|nr:hypothetical protein [Deltaproteobacteria bacterium]